MSGCEIRSDSRFPGLWMNVSLHLASPLEEAPQFSSLPPHEFPEFQESDLRHFDASVGFDTPQKVRTTPRGQVMTSSGVPQEAETVIHQQHHKRSLRQREAVKAATGPLVGGGQPAPC